MYGVEGSILDATSQDIYVYLYVYTFVCSCLDINPIESDVLPDFLAFSRIKENGNSVLL